MPLPSTILYPSASGGGGAGDVVGPASSTDNAIARYDGTTGKLLQNSAATIADTTGDLVWSGDAGVGRSAAGIVKVTDGSTGLGRIIVTDSLAGTGTIMFGGTGAGNAALGSSGTEIRAYAANLSAYGSFKGIAFRQSGGDATMAVYGFYSRRATTGFFSTSGAVGDSPVSYEAGLTGSSAGVWDAIANSVSTPGAIRQSRPVEANTAGSGAPNILAAIETNTVLTNEGSTATNYHTLPTAVAGYVFTFCVQDADGLRVTAAAADTIRVIDKVTAAAGYIESTAIGSSVTLQAINATEWFATSIKGVWTDGTWSYDDTSLTSP